MLSVTVGSPIHRDHQDEIEDWCTETLRVNRWVGLRSQYVWRATRIGRWALLHRYTDPPRLGFWYMFLGIPPAVARRLPIVVPGWWE